MLYRKPGSAPPRDGLFLKRWSMTVLSWKEETRVFPSVREEGGRGGDLRGIYYIHINGELLARREAATIRGTARARL